MNLDKLSVLKKKKEFRIVKQDLVKIFPKFFEILKNEEEI
jgi:hypothetical protein